MQSSGISLTIVYFSMFLFLILHALSAVTCTSSTLGPPHLHTLTPLTCTSSTPGPPQPRPRDAPVGHLLGCAGGARPAARAALCHLRPQATGLRIARSGNDMLVIALLFDYNPLPNLLSTPLSTHNSVLLSPPFTFLFHPFYL